MEDELPTRPEPELVPTTGKHCFINRWHEGEVMRLLRMRIESEFQC